MPGEGQPRQSRSAYKHKWHERGHSCLEVTMSGLVIIPEYSWCGASPDGVVHDPGCTDPTRLLEIKCPYNYRDSTPFQAASQKVFCYWLEKGKLVLREHHHYCYEMQGQMAICSRKRCDFVVFTNVGISVQWMFFPEIF